MKNPFNPGYYNEQELETAGFRSLGRHVQIAKNCTIIGLENIEIGDYVRIDGYCTIIAAGQGWVRLESYIHIGAYCLLSAGDGIHMKDFSGISQGVRLYSRTDDYTGESMTNPMVPSKYTGVKHGTVTLGRHSILGSGSIVLPDVTIGEGCSIGALSMVTKSLDPWGVYFGCPAKRLKDRSQKLLQLEAELLRELSPPNQESS